MSDLIQRAEQAATREEAVAVFCGAGEYWLETGRAYHADFDRHIAQAIRSKSATRALGYLLLAAMAVVPEGWLWSVGKSNSHDYTGPRAFLWRPSIKALFGRAHYPCTALLSAILKTEATNG